MLPEPGVRIDSEIAAFNKENKLEEQALTRLLEAFPRNREASHTLLKVIAINRLYSARVRDKDTVALAEHIASRDDLDDLLDRGSPATVPFICDAPTSLQYFSFATKFCSWHNQAAYSMWDGNVDGALWAYKQQHKFTEYKRAEVGDYERFMGIVAAFRSHYGLNRYSMKDIDKFLWRVGGLVIAERQRK
jgi:hypothetical protein